MSDFAKFNCKVILGCVVVYYGLKFTNYMVEEVFG